MKIVNMKGRNYLELSCDSCSATFLRRKSTKAENTLCTKCLRSLSPKNETGIKEKPVKCAACSKPIYRGSEMCKPCSAKSRVKPSKSCVDCGVAINRKAVSRCIKCHNKRQDKGMSTERARFGASKAWARVRKQCFERDGYTCQSCMVKGGELNAHHIEHYAKNKELRLSLSNLITLCVKCHREVHFGKNRKHTHSL